LNADRCLLAVTAAALLGTAACSPKAPSAQAPVQAQAKAPVQAQQYHLTATVRDLMEGLIDPSADALWDSVAYIASTSGTEDRQPRTAAEWQAVRTSAVNLIEAANLLSMPGRVVADPADHPKSPGPGELSQAEIQQRIDASHDAFVQFARGLQAAGLQALAAIDAKNAQSLMDSGTTIDEACEACHMTYWYPDQRRP
jgi:cytochrome c556